MSARRQFALFTFQRQREVSSELSLDSRVVVRPDGRSASWSNHVGNCAKSCCWTLSLLCIVLVTMVTVCSLCVFAVEAWSQGEVALQGCR